MSATPPPKPQKPKPPRGSTPRPRGRPRRQTPSIPQPDTPETFPEDTTVLRQVAGSSATPVDVTQLDQPTNIGNGDASQAQSLRYSKSPEEQFIADMNDYTGIRQSTISSYKPALLRWKVRGLPLLLC